MPSNRAFSKWAKAVLALAVIAVLGLVSTAYAQRGGFAALLADVHGKVDLQAPGSRWTAATIMTTLPTGCLVRVGAGGTATLAFVHGGARTTVQGPATVRVGTDNVGILKGTSKAIQTKHAAERSTALLPANVNIQKMGGEVSRTDPRVSLQMIGDAVLADRTPALAWKTRETYSHFEVRVVEMAAGEREAFRASVPGGAREIRLPADHPLEYGKQYGVQLVGCGTERVEAPPHEITVLDQAGAERVAQARREAEAQYAAAPADVTPLVILLSVYTNEKLYEPALDVAQRVLKQRPHDRSLQLLVGRLYQARHEGDRAKIWLQRAGVNSAF